MANLEYLLWAYFILYPLYLYLTHEKEIQRVTAQPRLRTATYRATMIHLWLPTLLLLVLFNDRALGVSDLGLTWRWHLPNQIAVASVAVTAGYFLAVLRRLDSSSEAREALRKQLGHMQWFMPTSKEQLRWFVFGLAVSAGICEELLFRAYLVPALGQHMPVFGAVLISSIAFGLGHVYQGWSHVVRTGILGAVMAVVFLITDSIFVPIVLHAMVDMFSGVIGYKIYAEPGAGSDRVSEVEFQ